VPGVLPGHEEEPELNRHVALKSLLLAMILPALAGCPGAAPAPATSASAVGSGGRAAPVTATVVAVGPPAVSELYAVVTIDFVNKSTTSCDVTHYVVSWAAGQKEAKVEALPGSPSAPAAPVSRSGRPAKRSSGTTRSSSRRVTR
jgi:hypothetical protein